VGDDVPIHVGPGAADGPGDGEHGGAWSGAGTSSRRIVHEPSRRVRLVAVVVLAGLVAGGVLLLRDGGRDGPEPPPPGSADDAYVVALGRLGRAGSFAYRGTVQATGRSPLRPGTWVDARVSVEGAVLLPHSMTREVAVAQDGGGAVETVTSGSTVWSRAASSRSGLPGASWELVAWTDSAPGLPSTPNPESFASRRLGIALVVDLLRAAGNRRRGPSEVGGNRPLLATVPIGGGHRVHSGDLLAGAEVMLGLDEAGDVTDLTLSSAPDDERRLEVELELVRLGEPGLIGAADVGRPARGALPLGDLAVAGVDPLELSWLPSGWALTAAVPARTGRLVMCAGGAGRCVASDEGCRALHLEYRDITRVSGGRLSLSMTPRSCVAGWSGTGDMGAEPFRAGRFIGSVDESATTIGVVTDGGTAISFTTDLSADDAAVVLATLVTFDAATDPAVLPGIPSS
jgi:hypothetical protein